MVYLPTPVSAFLVGSLLAAASSLSALSGTAAAQTIVLNQPSQVTDTTIRSGSYANTNLDDHSLITRRSSDSDFERRSLLKFDTSNTIPAGSGVTSATLMLTVKSGLGTSGATRTLSIYREPSAFQESQATWMTRQSGTLWSTAGGDHAELVAQVAVKNTAGSKVTINVTNIVQNTVKGQYGSRYTRFLILDAGTATEDSYREFYSSEESNSALRPTLTVALSGTTDSVTSTTSTIKVMQWNLGQRLTQVDNVVAFIVANRPDIISFNEITHYASYSADMPRLIADKLKAKTGQTWSYHWVQKWGATSGEGECVMTRLPVEASDGYLLPVQRSVAMLRVRVNGRIIDAFSTHLENTSTDNATRVLQVDYLTAWALGEPEQRIVAGDFNGWPGTPVYNEMIKKSHVDSWVTAKSKGVAVTYAGNPDGNTKNTRIDYVWYSKGATLLTVTRAQVFNTSLTISDHRPVMVTFRVN